MKAFFGEEMGAYWFATGTPTFLVRRMKSMHFDVRQFEGGMLHATSAALGD